jgi:hypothetical protein
MQHTGALTVHRAAPREQAALREDQKGRGSIKWKRWKTELDKYKAALKAEKVRAHGHQAPPPDAERQGRLSPFPLPPVLTGYVSSLPPY